MSRAERVDVSSDWLRRLIDWLLLRNRLLSSPAPRRSVHTRGRWEIPLPRSAVRSRHAWHGHSWNSRVYLQLHHQVWRGHQKRFTGEHSVIRCCFTLFTKWRRNHYSRCFLTLSDRWEACDSRESKTVFFSNWATLTAIFLTTELCWKIGAPVFNSWIHMRVSVIRRISLTRSISRLVFL